MATPLAVLFPLVAAAAEPPARYATDAARLVSWSEATRFAPDHEADRESLRQLRLTLKARELRVLRLGSGDGQLRQLLPRRGASGDLSELSPSQALAATFVLNTYAPGVEVDLLCADADGLRPVTLRWPQADALELVVGAPWVGPTSTIGDLAAFLERWDLQLETDGQVDWSEDELVLLDLALSLLRPEELERVRALPFRRSLDVQRLDTGERMIASYRYDPHQGYRFEFYDLDLRPEVSGFVGEPGAPLPGELLTVLHELGHAVADHRRRTVVAPLLSIAARLNGSASVARQAQDRLAQAPGDAAARADLQRAVQVNEAALAELGGLGLDLDRLDQAWAWQVAEPPVAAELVRRVGSAPPVTPYAATAATEHFAELFAYTHADPAAMRRVYPEAAAWLRDASYLQVVDAEAPPWATAD